MHSCKMMWLERKKYHIDVLTFNHLRNKPHVRFMKMELPMQEGKKKVGFSLLDLLLGFHHIQQPACFICKYMKRKKKGERDEFVFGCKEIQHICLTHHHLISMMNSSSARHVTSSVRGLLCICLVKACKRAVGFYTILFQILSPFIWFPSFSTHILRFFSFFLDFFFFQTLGVWNWFVFAYVF